MVGQVDGEREVHVVDQPFAAPDREALDGDTGPDRLQAGHLAVAGQDEEPVEALHQHVDRLRLVPQEDSGHDLVGEPALARLAVPSFSLHVFHAAEEELHALDVLVCADLPALAEVVHHADVEVRPALAEVGLTLRGLHLRQDLKVLRDLVVVRVRHRGLVVDDVDGLGLAAGDGADHDPQSADERQDYGHGGQLHVGLHTFFSPMVSPRPIRALKIRLY